MLGGGSKRTVMSASAMPMTPRRTISPGLSAPELRCQSPVTARMFEGRERDSKGQVAGVGRAVPARRTVIQNATLLRGLRQEFGR